MTIWPHSLPRYLTHWKKPTGRQNSRIIFLTLRNVALRLTVTHDNVSGGLMTSKDPQPAPNYTNAALTMAWVNLMWIFMLIWGVWGFLPALLVGAGLNRGITWLSLRRG